MITLRYYQTAAIEAIYDALRKREDNPCAVLPTASGKTPIIATICKDAVTQWNGRVLVIAHVKELLQQTADKLNMICPDVKAGVYSAGLGRRDTEHPVIIGGIQSIYKRACELDSFDIVIIDECFIAGTPISTPRGDVPIEKLRVGQQVMTALGTGTIDAISAKPSNTLLKIEVENGKSITCTPEHPFFTEQGWTKASSLEIGSCLFSIEDMRLLRQAVQTMDQVQAGRDDGIMLSRKALEQAALLFEILFKESREPNVLEKCKGKSQTNTLETETQADPEGRKWKPAANSSISPSACIRTRLGSRVCCNDRCYEGERDAMALQAGHCQSKGTDCYRIGREQSSKFECERCRSTEDVIPLGSRVVSVTTIEQPGTTPVFNLHIREHPSYYAGGFLVHNCHMIPSEGEGMYRTFLEDARKVNPNLRVIGLTATPFRLKSGMICGPDNVLNHICYEIGVKELIRDGYLCPLISKAGAIDPDTSEVHIRAGEFIAGELQEVMDRDALVDSACDEIIKYTMERNSVLVFSAGVDHGKHIATVLESKTTARVATVFGETNDTERDTVLNEFKQGRIKFLVNMGVLTTGFDAPNIDCVAMLRPTMSPGLFYQMVGRGFRLHPDKENCLVLDFGGNIMRHGPVDMISVTDMSRGAGTRSEPPAKKCPECSSVIHPSYSICPDCGYEFPPPEKTKHDAKASTDGILSGEKTVTRYDVQETQYHIHYKNGAPVGAPTTMRVDYWVNLREKFSEWVCFEHSGYARDKSAKWWAKRSKANFPSTTEEAVFRAKDGALATTNAITVCVTSGLRFPQIVEYELGEIPEADQFFDFEAKSDIPVHADCHEEEELPF